MTEHLMGLYKAATVESDYPFEADGSTHWIATCSCGWWQMRQFEHAARNQQTKHLQAVCA